MKLLICLLALAGTVFSAVPTVVIDDNWNAIVDGSNSGFFGDVIVNNKNDAALAVAINLAVRAKSDAVKADVATAQAARQAAETAKATETARVAAIVTALKGVSPTLLPANVRAELQTAREKERAALLARKAEVEAQIATLP